MWCFGSPPVSLILSTPPDTKTLASIDTVVGYQIIPHSVQVNQVWKCFKSLNLCIATFFPSLCKNLHISQLLSSIPLHVQQHPRPKKTLLPQSCHAFSTLNYKGRHTPNNKLTQGLNRESQVSQLHGVKPWIHKHRIWNQKVSPWLTWW